MVIPKHALNLSCSRYSLVLKKISHLRVFWACVFFSLWGPVTFHLPDDKVHCFLYNHCSLLHGITNRQWIEKGDGSLDRTARTPDNKGTLSQVNAMFLNKVILISVLHSQFRNENVLIILQNSYNYIKVEIKFASL